MPRDHRELICWQLSDELRQLIIEHTKEGTPAAKDERFTKNLRDAIGSACRNQSEGFYKYWHTEQRPFFNIARGSLGETKDGIQEGLERAYFAPEVSERMFNLCKRAMKANLNWLKSLKRRDPKRDRGDQNQDSGRHP
jgi:four helix bundle protein